MRGCNRRSLTYGLSYPALATHHIATRQRPPPQTSNLETPRSLQALFFKTNLKSVKETLSIQSRYSSFFLKLQKVGSVCIKGLHRELQKKNQQKTYLQLG